MKKLDARARTTEVDDTSDRLIVLFKNEAALQTDNFLKTLFDEMQTVSAQITEAIKRDRFYSDLEDADALRDNHVRALGNILRGYTSVPVEQYSTPAKQLYSLFQKYGVEITRENYASESSFIESMLTDLSVAEMQTAVAALPGVAEAVANLRTAQTDFTAKRVAYEKAIAAGGSGPSASDIKKPLLNLINNRMITYIDAMKMVDEAKYGHFADAAEQIIKDTNTAILARTAKPALPEIGGKEDNDI